MDKVIDQIDPRVKNLFPPGYIDNLYKDRPKSRDGYPFFTVDGFPKTYERCKIELKVKLRYKSFKTNILEMSPKFYDDSILRYWLTSYGYYDMTFHSISGKGIGLAFLIKKDLFTVDNLIPSYNKEWTFIPSYDEVIRKMDRKYMEHHFVVFPNVKDYEDFLGN